MSVFVNYGGPKLDKKQKQLVRSQAMVSVRGQQKQNKSAHKETKQKLNPRRLAPAPSSETQTDSSEEDQADSAAALQDAVGTHCQNSNVALPNSGRKRTGETTRRFPNQSKGTVVRLQQQRSPPSKPNPYDLRGAPPQSTHMTGVDARTFQDYLVRCGSYSSYLDEAFVLVGFRQPSYFRPDMSKAACIYIGWLLTAGVLDAFRGTVETLSYPYYEYQAVKELQGFIDGADARALHEVVYPVVILGMFEMVRFSPRTITHLAAVENFIKSRGGLKNMPDVMQHIVLMGDTLQCVCLDTPLAFNTIGSAPTLRLMTTTSLFLAGDQLLSCPLLLCDDEDFSLAARYVAAPAISDRLVGVLRAANHVFRQFFHLDGLQGTFHNLDRLVTDLDAIADSPTATNDAPGLFLETCALAARIMRRTWTEELSGFDHPANEVDLMGIYDNARFIGLKGWTGLPYVYVWVNLIGFAASRDKRMKSYFIAEVVRCAFSYGCYQMEIFQAVLKNFLHLRGAVAGRRTEQTTLYYNLTYR